MTEITRKLASVRRIDAIDSIPDADRIVCATIGGWKLVTQKSNNFQVGDLVVYFEIDSFLPVCEKFEFLRKSSFKSTSNLGDGFRIKTIRLKGQVSQGLILPVDEFVEEIHQAIFPDNICREGVDLTEILGVQKYEKPIPANLAGNVRGNFPSFLRKTDQERIQNLKRDFSRWCADNTLWEVTEKLDGSSMTVYNHEGVFGVCSRNMDLMEDEGNAFWQVANKLGLRDMVADGFAIQGELVGPGVQGNKYGLKELEFYLFDVYDIKKGEYLKSDDRLEHWGELKHAPILGLIDLGIYQDEGISGLISDADGASLIGNKSAREGAVFKNTTNGDVSFKVISNKWLLKNEE